MKAAVLPVIAAAALNAGCGKEEKPFCEEKPASEVIETGVVNRVSNAQYNVSVRFKEALNCWEGTPFYFAVEANVIGVRPRASDDWDPQNSTPVDPLDPGEEYSETRFTEAVANYEGPNPDRGFVHSFNINPNETLTGFRVCLLSDDPEGTRDEQVKPFIILCTPERNLVSDAPSGLEGQEVAPNEDGYAAPAEPPAQASGSEVPPGSF